jgi:hypothetical protein
MLTIKITSGKLRRRRIIINGELRIENELSWCQFLKTYTKFLNPDYLQYFNLFSTTSQNKESTLFEKLIVYFSSKTLKISMKKVIIFSVLAFLTACSTIVPLFIAPKEYSATETPNAEAANKYFWDNYHQGNYDSIPKIVEKLNFALQENPNDLKITVHLGFVHIWALSERQRIKTANPSTIEHIFLSKRYFEEAYLMNPHDPRVVGFLADISMIEGDQLKNNKIQTEGYYTGLKSVKMWPQFNKFTLGYLFSNLDKSDEKFKKGIEWQYETIDDCACEKDTKKTDYKAAIAKIRKSKDPMIYRACWNSWIVPHNWEGFCMNWGDMLIKNGEVNEGIRIYNLAKESDSYNEWPYKSELEIRIQNASKNVADFNKPIDNQNISTQNVIMLNSKMSCTGCHQMSKNEFEKMGYKKLDSENYFLKK